MPQIRLIHGTRRPVHIQRFCNLPGASGGTCKQGIGIHDDCCTCREPPCEFDCVPPTPAAVIKAPGCSIDQTEFQFVEIIPPTEPETCLQWEVTLPGLINCSGPRDLIIQIRWRHQDTTPQDMQMRYRVDGVQAWTEGIPTVETTCNCLIWDMPYWDPLCDCDGVASTLEVGVCSEDSFCLAATLIQKCDPILADWYDPFDIIDPAWIIDNPLGGGTYLANGGWAEATGTNDVLGYTGVALRRSPAPMPLGFNTHRFSTKLGYVQDLTGAPPPFMQVVYPAPFAAGLYYVAGLGTPTVTLTLDGITSYAPPQLAGASEVELFLQFGILADPWFIDRTHFICAGFTDPATGDYVDFGGRLYALGPQTTLPAPDAFNLSGQTARVTGYRGNRFDYVCGHALDVDYSGGAAALASIPSSVAAWLGP